MVESTFYIEKLALIGVGLIGGSLVKSLRSHHAVGQVVGVGRSVDNLIQAKEIGVIDEYSLVAAEAVRNAQVVVIAAPVGAFEVLLTQILPEIGEDTIITDVGSVKTAVIEAARRVMGDKIDQFVPAHPIAGAEKSGVGAAKHTLFIDHKLIITPLTETRTDFISTIAQMWALTGSQVMQMDMHEHDKILGLTSHLPHVLAYAMIDFLSKQENQQQCDQFSAGGLYDLTRTASSDAVMWRDIILNNKDNISMLIRQYSNELNLIADHIDADNAEELQRIFENAKQVRARLTDLRSKQE